MLKICKDYCLGCTSCEIKSFQGDKNCEYYKQIEKELELAKNKDKENYL